MLTEGVFDGIRVLDIGHIVAGPFVASVMADFGADVIKIEPPVRGDPLRWQYPKNGAGLFYKMQARNKKSVTLDLKSPEGRELFHRMVEKSDVVVENFRPGVMERLGCGWEELSKINPRLIMCRLSSFGQTGPDANRRSYGRVGEAFAGFAHITGEPDGPPEHSHMSVGDTIAGTWAAMGVMMALYWRDAKGSGVGQVVDIGLYEGVYRQIEQQIIILDQLGKVLGRHGSNHQSVPYTGMFKTKDARYYSFSAVTEASAGDLLRAMGLNEDHRFNNFQRCLENRGAFTDAVTKWMGERTLDEVDKAFRQYCAPGSPVNTAADLIDHPHLLAREMVISVPDKELGTVRMQGVVPKLTKTPGKVRHAGQQLGESNETVFKELLGLSGEQIEGLKSRGVI